MRHLALLRPVLVTTAALVAGPTVWAQEVREAQVAAWRPFSPEAPVIGVSLGRDGLLPLVPAETTLADGICELLATPVGMAPSLLPTSVTRFDRLPDPLDACRIAPPEAPTPEVDFLPTRLQRDSVCGVVRNFGRVAVGCLPLSLVASTPMELPLGGLPIDLPDLKNLIVTQSGVVALSTAGKIWVGHYSRLTAAAEAASPFDDFAASGSLLGCGRLADGTVRCYGDEAVGELAAPPGQYIDHCVGPFHWCGLTAAGEVRCLGEDLYGETAIPAGPVYGALACGPSVTCVAEVEGEVRCYGRYADDALRPPPGLRAARLAVDARQACAVDHAGNIRCWGNHAYGRRADGTWDLPNGPARPARWPLW